MTKTVSRPTKTKIPSEEGRKSESLQQISTFICVNRIAFFLLLNCFLFVLPITGTYVLKDSLWAEGERAAGSLPYIRIVAFLMGSQQKKKPKISARYPVASLIDEESSPWFQLENRVRKQYPEHYLKLPTEQRHLSTSDWSQFIQQQ